MNTGEWSKKAIKEAQADSPRSTSQRAPRTGRFTYVPAQADWKLDAPTPRTCTTRANETIGGVEYHWIARDRRRAAGRRHVVATSSPGRSTSRRYGLIYAGAQKNIGPAGLTIVIVRDDLIGAGASGARRRCSTTRTHAKADSMHNTPPTYAIYIAGLVFKRMLATGGLAGDRASATSPRPRCSTTTSTTAASTRNPVGAADRSRMNVPFTLARRGAGRRRS